MKRELTRYLTSDEILKASKLAFDEFYKRRSTDKRNFQSFVGQWNFQCIINAIVSEVAVANYLGLKWLANCDKCRFGDDVEGGIEVKYTAHMQGNLILDDYDFLTYPDDKKLVLVVGDVNKNLIGAGWCFMSFFKERSTPRNNAGRFSHWLDQRYLDDMVVLKDMMLRENKC